jgi:hypothetical protein
VIFGIKHKGKPKYIYERKGAFRLEGRESLEGF